MSKKEKCEVCGKHTAIYLVEPWLKNQPLQKLCCVCVDKLCTMIPEKLRLDLINHG